MSALFGALKNKMFGSSASSSAPKEADEDRTPPSSAPTSPQRSTVASTLAFTPPRPEDAEPAEEFELPQGALDGGSEVARAIVSLYIQAPGRAIEEKLPRTLLLLTKTAPFTYQFKVCSNDKVVIRQPLVSSLTFYFKPVRITRHTSARCRRTASGRHSAPPRRMHRSRTPSAGIAQHTAIIAGFLPRSLGRIHSTESNRSFCLMLLLRRVCPFSRVTLSCGT
jgi:hypothetical protein